ncbi:MAG: hypothetical protein MZV65_18635 [Chromatiales bacterium]|nr:hypothetical protein [Chromatiales bacterium]
MMDTQPWDYWEAAGAKPKGRAARARRRAGDGAARAIPTHPGAIHLYIHAVEASTQPERALPHARRLGRADAGRRPHRAHAGAHLLPRRPVHASRSRPTSARSRVDEQLLQHRRRPTRCTSSAYYPHNIHFVMVSAQMGGDGRDRDRRRGEARRDRCPDAWSRSSRSLQPVKAAPYTDARAVQRRRRRSSPCRRPPNEPGAGRRRCTTTRARVAFARRRRTPRRRSARSTRSRAIEQQGRLQAVRRLGRAGARRSCRPRGSSRRARLADAQGDLEGAARAYEEAIIDRGLARLHGAAVLVLPGAPVAGLGAPAAGQARRGREGVPRLARARARATAGRWRASPRPTSRKGDVAGEARGARWR